MKKIILFLLMLFMISTSNEVLAQKKNIIRTNAQKILSKKGKVEAASYYGSVDAYKALCERKDIDLVVGTEGYASKYPVQQLLFKTEALKNNDIKANYDKLDAHSALPNSIRDMMLEKYTPQYVKEIRDVAKKVGGHGGMDYIMDYRLVY